MAKKNGQRKPTDGELAILSVIWDRGAATVRQVFVEMGQTQDIGYTTVLKMMQIMTEKGLLTRDTSVRPQVFTPATPRKQTQKMLLRELLDRAFSGSPGGLVLQALALKKSSPEELRQIRDMLDALEEEGS